MQSVIDPSSPDISQPLLKIPCAMKANDNDFTRDRVENMFLAIGRKMLSYMETQKQFSSEVIQSIESLLKTIPNEQIPYRTNNDQFEDTPYWKGTLAKTKDSTWLDLEWIFAETYLNREFNILTGNLCPIGDRIKQDTKDIDPYKDQKEAGLTKLPNQIIEFLVKRQETYINTELKNEHLESLILGSISGNQADLSKWPNLNSSIVSTSQPLSDFAINNLETVLPYLMNLNQKEPIEFAYFLDNSGMELFSDLCLIDYLLTMFKSSKLVLYVKPVPFMVSDVTQNDLDFTFMFLNKYSKEFVGRLKNCIKQERLIIKSHYFLTTYLPYWEAPIELLQEIQTKQLTFFKGEFNYIKIIGAQYWQRNASFKDITVYFKAHIVALKISKAPIAIGLDLEWLEKTFPEGGDEWLQTGKWAFLQSNF